jgi:magnesium transporter
MSTRFKKRRKSLHRRTKPGAAPGTLIADPEALRSVVDVVCYNSQTYLERPLTEITEIPSLLENWNVVWININGLGDLHAIRGLGEMFGLHRLTLEDIVNVHQRPKVEQYKDYLLIVLQEAVEGEEIDTDQVSMILGSNYVLTFQECKQDGFKPVRERIREGKGFTRHSGSGYLCYALIDCVIDNYFPVIERFSERLEKLEQAVISKQIDDGVMQTYSARRDLIVLRRAIWPLREAVSSLIRDPSKLFSPEIHLYLRDCYDHTVQLLDLIETHRELASDLIAVNLSMVSNRTNDVMKVLTLIATIFMPLTFISGLYGMNFHPESSPYNMPELNWRYGYPFVLGLMLLIAGGMLYFFKRRGWIFTGRSRIAAQFDEEKTN